MAVEFSKKELSMNYRRLGRTYLDVSVICMGPMRAAATEPGNDEKSKAGELALRTALDAGVNFIHSSYEYRTRWMMGRVLANHPGRSELHHVIKVPVPDSTDGDHFEADKFRLRIEEALTDLHTERISVLQWMWRSKPNTDERRLPLLGQIIDEVVDIFHRMRDEGKVGYLMTFPYTVPCGKKAIETGKFSGLIGFYNLVEMEMADLFGELQQRDMGFLAIRPLYQGILTDERANQNSLRKGDRFADEKYAIDFAKRAKISEVFRDEIGESMTSFAIRFALTAPIVSSLIVGLNTPAQVSGIIAAAEDSSPSLQTVEKAREIWRSGFGFG